jgi:hypothetical protein
VGALGVFVLRSPRAGRRVKACVYCMAPNYTRGRCCCPEHARKVSSALSSHRAACRRTLEKIAAERHRLRVLNGQWRDVAFGRDADAQILRIFGLTAREGLGWETE